MKKCLALCIICSMCFSQSLPILQDSIPLSKFKIENLQMNLNKAGENLKSARTAFFLSVLISTAGTVFILTANDEVENDSGETIGLALNLVAVVVGIFSWIQVGSAGSKLQNIDITD